jgi:hypothetical protein
MTPPDTPRQAPHVITNVPMANPRSRGAAVDLIAALPAFLDEGTALCAEPGRPRRLWTSDDAADELAAKRYCRACPLRAECLDYALTAKEPAGVWGGLTARERSSLRTPAPRWVDPSDRARRPCGSNAAYKAHRMYRETCEECEAAHEVAVRTRRLERLAVAHEAGGTPTGATLHRRLGEPVCEPCRLAVVRQSAARRAALQRPVQGAAAAA